MPLPLTGQHVLSDDVHTDQRAHNIFDGKSQENASLYHPSKSCCIKYIMDCYDLAHQMPSVCKGELQCNPTIIDEVFGDCTASITVFN